MDKTLSVYELYPHADDRTKEKLLGGLTNVTRVEFLQSLPGTDPRKKELENIVYPGPERRAVLEKNLEAMDKYLVAVAGVRTRNVFETVARLGLDENEIFGDEEMDFDELGNIVDYVEENRDELEEGAYWSELRLLELILKFLHRRLCVPL